MRKAILAPLASALVIPGLGQLLVGQVKKGVVILVGNLLAFSGGAALIFRFLLRSLKARVWTAQEPTSLLKAFPGEDAPLFWAVVIAFSGLWLYAVVDAFWAGWKWDHAGEEPP